MKLLAPLALASLLLACSSPARAPTGRSLNLSLPTDTGAIVRVPSPSSRSTLVYYWAITCAPCRESMPKMQARKSEIEKKGAHLQLVAVLADSESTAQARDTLASWGVKAPFAVDGDGSAMKQAGVAKVPSYVVVDESGAVLWASTDSSTLDDAIAALP